MDNAKLRITITNRISEYMIYDRYTDINLKKMIHEIVKLLIWLLNKNELRTTKEVEDSIKRIDLELLALKYGDTEYYVRKLLIKELKMYLKGKFEPIRVFG